MITIEIPLEPYAQERARFARAGRFVKTYDGAKSKAWKAAARIYMRAALRGVEIPVFPKEAAVAVRLVFWFPLPKSARRKRKPPGAQWYTGLMDWDNLAKCVCDAGNGLLWADDRQIVHGVVEKYRVAQGGRKPGVWIEARQVDPEEVADG